MTSGMSQNVPQSCQRMLRNDLRMNLELPKHASELIKLLSECLTYVLECSEMISDLPKRASELTSELPKHASKMTLGLLNMP